MRWDGRVPLHRFLPTRQTSLISGADGNLYGTTAYGESSALRTIFRMALDGTVQVLHRFDAPADGILPLGLVQASDGRFYGTTADGGIRDFGTAFVMDLAGVTTVLHRFDGGTEGAIPEAPLIQANDGNFYGTTALGGAGNFGTIFRVTPSGRFTLLYTFAGGYDGGFPRAALVQGRDGALYGTTSSRGAYNEGIMFRVTPEGSFSILHAFNSVLDGGRPIGLTPGTDGNFYGATTFGGAAGHGIVFRATPAGAVTVLHAFTGVAEGRIGTALIQASDGNFYGISEDYPDSSVFRISPSGSFTIVRRLPWLGYGASTLAQGADGNLYGATTCGFGKLFRMPLSGGDVTVLGDTGTTCSDYYPNPVVTLTRGIDGTIYGTVSEANVGEPHAPFFLGGVVFRIDAAGAVTALVQFRANRPEPRGVTQAADGNLYVTTRTGGTARSGSVVRLNHRVPLSPTSVIATPAGINAVTLRWTGTAGATSYVIRRIVAGQPPTVVPSGLTTTTFTVPLDASGADASYVVTAVNAAGESLTSTPMHVPWGAAGSRTPTVTTVRDYDGDGKADLTVYRSSTADWFTLQSADNQLANAQWGAPALLDRPVPADYDGDGKADVAIYRQSTGSGSSIDRRTARSARSAGERRRSAICPCRPTTTATARPTSRSFAGTTGEWFVHRSSDGALLHLGWGAPALGDLPVPADYDGDGKPTSRSIEARTGEWFVYQSTNGALLHDRLGIAGPGRCAGAGRLRRRRQNRPRRVSRHAPATGSSVRDSAAHAFQFWWGPVARRRAGARPTTTATAAPMSRSTASAPASGSSCATGSCGRSPGARRSSAMPSAST